VDAAYYTFPSPKYLAGLAAQTPAGFQFGFKVTARPAASKDELAAKERERSQRKQTI
jgi:uncharacterized protein YecE (DUF72 family)